MLRHTGIYMCRMFFVAFAVFILECQITESVDLGNVALNKPATQVSTYIENGQHWSARHAVDGNTNCVYPPTGQYYSATNSTDKAWWRVDLQNVYNIYRIVVRGNKNDENGQLIGFGLYLTESPNDNPVASTSVYTATKYGNGTFDIPISKTARYCLLQNPADNNPIVLCEVEIYANTTDFLEQIKPNVSTSMSSISNWNSPPNSWSSNNAIDNVIRGDPNTCSCCAGTNYDQQPWLQLDLGRSYSIGFIKIYGRTDGSSAEQFQDLYVYVDKSPMTTTNGTFVYHGNPNDGSYTFNIEFDQPRSFRYLVIKRFKGSVITICEIQLVEEKNLVDLLKHAAKTSQSSIFYDTDSYNSSKAIDRLKNYTVDSCKCCSVTNSSTLSWWQLNLGNKYLVNVVEVFGRQSGAEKQLQHGIIYASNVPMSSGLSSATKVFTVPTIVNSSHFRQRLHHPVIAQYLIVTLANNILTLCEFNAYGIGPICDTGKFGDDCSKKCHCADRRSCHYSTGICHSKKCLPGWQGFSCDKVCDDGYYGQNCTTPCAGHCKNGNSKCNNIDGKCNQGCVDGYVGELCDQACPLSKYGTNCSQTCNSCTNRNCSNTDGVCFAGCVPGYKPDNPNCHAPCEQGTYGQNCSHHCTGHCLHGNAQCHTTNGSCKQGCESGYFEGMCDTPCQPSTYGTNCSQTCNTCTNKTCRNTDGLCTSGCVSGYKPNDDYCRTSCESGTYGQNCSRHCTGNCLHGNIQCDTATGRCKQGCKSGYIGDTCDTECQSGYYGLGCNATCHQCKTGTTCDFRNGSCAAGCMLGYHGTRCDQECASGYFGDCTHFCHCMNNSLCSKVDGSCPSGCDFGWSGKNCSFDLNIIQRDENVNTSQSGMFGHFDSTKAIDGKEQYDVDTCNCCSVTYGTTPSWWQIDLGNKYLVRAIRVYGRGDIGRNNVQLEYSTIFIGNATLTNENSSEIPIYQIPKITNTNVFTHILDKAIIAQFIIVRHSTAILTICEFKAYEKVCDIGKFGSGCNHKCHCMDRDICDSVSGNCQTPGCFPGWRGDSCELECEATNFGAECNEICHCINQTNCDHVNGTCEKLECDPGWIGESCSTICSFGTFGSDCNSTCHCINNSACNNVNGSCDIAECDPGWTGTACNQECDNGRFGPGCKQYCHCINNTACNNVNGICEINQCNPGWIGNTCETECVIGKFGQDCNSSCHCINNTVCNNVNGTCSSGRCEPGWLRDACDKVCDRGTFGAGCNCSCHCINETTCNNVNGKCGVRQCSPGWRGDACDTECADGNFGPDCKLFCHCIDNSVCNNVNGTCYSGECDAGWLGEACDKECDIGTFGKNCGSICHCINDTQCDNVNGICQERMCSPGWTKDTCDTGCDTGQFGQGCNSTCHCTDDTSCDKVNGTCRDEGCATDWEGPACQIKALHQTGNDKGPSSAGVAGGVGAAVGLLALGVLIAVVVYKRRKAKESPDERSQFSHLDKALKARHCSKEASDTYAQSNMSFEGEQETSMNNSGEGDYYSFGGPSIGVKVHELWDYIKETMENKCQQLFTEFKTLPSGLVHPCKAADDITNKGKNRYREMYAYDHTRVILEDVEENVNTDYINACYINGYEKAKKFVASQGPTKTMVDDFWRMAWQLKSDKIVMLTNLTELGAVKCFQYWPKEGVEEEHCFGNVIVKVTGIETSLDYNIRHFEVRKNNERARQIRQFHFKSWPDKDVPDSTWCLANFWRAVDTNAPSKAGPIVVHCSAGIGRTGTFIALDNLVSQAKVEGCVRPLQMVETLRRQRVNMVQTREQYVYLHEVVADALLFGTHIVWTKQFGEMFAFLVQKRKGETRAYLEKQFDLIERSATDVTGDAADTAEYSNVETIQSESAAYRPKLKNRGSQFVQELHALYIPNYRKKNTFLVSMSPDKDTIEEFWSLVDDNNIKTIIMLTERSAPCYQSSCELGSSSNNGNRFSVHKIEEKIRKCYTERTFTFKESDREDEDYLTTVKQFEYTAWKDGYIVPGDTRSLLDMIESVTNWQPHLAESQPILIHCRDGCSRSGIVCVLLNELQRMKHEGGHINILESVKLMKKRQKFLIGTYEQYRFCFDLMLAHIKTTENLYENL